MMLQTIIGTALIDREFCKELMNGKRPNLLAEFDLTDEEREVVLAIKSDSIQKFAAGLYERPTDAEVFFVECLAWGLLRAYGIEEPPVPVREMIKHPLPIFERLALLELNLGLYNATYRSCLDGSRLIVVDLVKPRVVQRASMAREMYVAFCRSHRAAELCWPHCEQPHTCSDVFARCLLMPAAWVRNACTGAIHRERLTAHFGVPARMVAQRLSEVYHHTPSPAQVLSTHSIRGSQNMTAL
jgi:hypothetical protein